MLKLLLVAIWACLLTLGAGYGVVTWKTGQPVAVKNNDFIGGLDYVKTEAFSVPVIVEGKINGYIVLRLVFTIDGNLLRQMKVPMTSFVVDGAFRVIYAQTALNLEAMKKPDLEKLLKQISENINTRFKAKIVHDVLIDQFQIVRPNQK